MNKILLRIITMPERIRNYILFLFFSFDRWHISPSRNRMYPDRIVEYIRNNKKVNSICEIGCGLGDTIARIRVREVVGLDYDKNVLKAARFLYRKKSNMQFRHFIFPESKIDSKYDVIIAVNWLHEYEPEIIKKYFISYFTQNLNNEGIMIVDTVDHIGYKYCHNFNSYFSDFNCAITEIGNFKSGRSLLAITKR